MFLSQETSCLIDACARSRAGIGKYRWRQVSTVCLKSFWKSSAKFFPGLISSITSGGRQDAGVDERTVDVYVGRLRKSLIRKNGFDPIRGSFLTPLHCRLSSNQHHFIADFVNDGSSLDLDFVIHAEDAPGISLRGKPFRFVRHEDL